MEIRYEHVHCKVVCVCFSGLATEVDEADSEGGDGSPPQYC